MTEIRDVINNQQKPGVLSLSLTSIVRNEHEQTDEAGEDEEWPWISSESHLVDTMLGRTQTENDIFNLWVLMIMLLCY